MASIIINISNNNQCRNYSEPVCNLIKNGSFEQYLSCPVFNNTLDLINHWFRSYNNTQILNFNSTCNNIQISRNEIGGFFRTQFPSLPYQPFPSGTGLIGCGFNYSYIPLSHGQYLPLCENQ
jgi:hypothetical protein